MDQPGLAVTGTEITNLGANSKVLEMIMKDPTIPGLEDPNAASDPSNFANTRNINNCEVVCLDTQDAPHQEEPVTSLALAAQSDHVVPPTSPQDTVKVSPVNTSPVSQTPSGPVVTTREHIQAPVISSLKNASPSTASLGEMAEAGESSTKASDAAKENQAAPVDISERRKQCKYFVQYLVSFFIKLIHCRVLGARAGTKGAAGTGGVRDRLGRPSEWIL